MVRKRKQKQSFGDRLELAVVKVRLLELYAERDGLEIVRKRGWIETGDDRAIRLSIVLNTIDRLHIYKWNLEHPNDPR